MLVLDVSLWVIYVLPLLTVEYVWKCYPSPIHMSLCCSHVRIDLYFKLF